MIRIRPRAASPMVFDRGAIKAQRDKIKSRGEDPNYRFKSSDFISVWGNATTWFMITDIVLAFLYGDVSSEHINKLEVLRGQEFLTKRTFNAALGRQLGTSERSLFPTIEEAAVYSIPRLLWDHQYGKCCYCEKALDWRRESDVEHFRPKSRVQEDVNHRGYWWLAYDWNNYFLSCKGCNGTKSDKFPLTEEVRASDPSDKIKEKPILIHPIEEDPEPNFGFEIDKIYVKIIGTDLQGRAKQVIEKLTDMNSIPNMMARYAMLKDLEFATLMLKNAQTRGDANELEEIKRRIAEKTRQDQPYAAFCRAYFRKESLAAYLAPLSTQ